MDWARFRGVVIIMQFLVRSNAQLSYSWPERRSGRQEMSNLASLARWFFLQRNDITCMASKVESALTDRNGDRSSVMIPGPAGRPLRRGLFEEFHQLMD